jgi:exopolysaccharide biosynthesis polyprenyl glycosylphosphotransferase
MKKAEYIFSIILVPLDFAMFVLAGISAYYLRFSNLSTGIRPVIFNLSLSSFMPILLTISFAWLIVFALAGLYRMRSTQSFVNEFYSVVQASALGFVLIMATIFFSGELFNSRFIVLAGWIFAIAYVTIARIIVRLTQKQLLKSGTGVHKVVLVGDSKSADILMSKFSSVKTEGFEVVKRLKDFSLESSQELRDFLDGREVDEIIQADPNMSKSEIVRLYDFAYEFHLTFRYVADLLDAKVLKTEVTEIAGLPIVEVIKTPLEGWGRISKRIFDIFGSLALIILTSPITIITAIAIKTDSRGPILFSERDDGSPVYRVGQGGKLFKYFKFRSMRPGTDNLRYKELAAQDLRSGSPLVKIKDDPRITRVGKFIRRWSIDELVEFFLVLRGDMSLVGPRPHLPEEVAKYEHSHKKVLTIKPGITGMAQVSGRSDLSFEEEVKLDTYYIENWSLLMDLSILLKTPLAVLRSRNAE